MGFHFVDDGLSLEGEIVGPPLCFSNAVDHHVKHVVARLFRIEDGDIVGQAKPPANNNPSVVLVRFESEEFGNAFVSEPVILLVC